MIDVAGAGGVAVAIGIVCVGLACTAIVAFPFRIGGCVTVSVGGVAVPILFCLCSSGSFVSSSASCRR